MNTITPRAQAFAVPDGRVADLITAFLSGKSPNTLAGYRRDLERFCKFVKAPSIDDGARFLLRQGHGQANHLALKFRNFLTEQHLSSATVNRHLASLRSLVALARTLGIVPWKLDIKGLKSKSYRDTRGCGVEGVRAMLNAVKRQRQPKASRDEAILRLLFDLALRRGEVISLDITDVMLAEQRLYILGKGHTEKEPVTLPSPTSEAIAAWLNHHPTGEGALFVNFDRASRPKRITGTGLYTLIRRIGKMAGLITRPHGLRHAAITEVLTLTNGNLRMGQRFARHANPSTTIRYDDNRADAGGEAAGMLAQRL